MDDADGRESGPQGPQNQAGEARPPEAHGAKAPTPQSEPAKPGPQAATDKPATPQAEPAKPGAQAPADKPAAADPSSAGAGVAGGSPAAPAERGKERTADKTPPPDSGRAAGGGPPRGPSATPPPPRGGGGARASVWGLVGGVIGGVAAWLVITYAVEPLVGVDVAALRARVSDLDQRVEEVEAAGTGGSPAGEEFAARLDRLEEQVAGAGPDEAQVTDFRDRLVALETDVAEISAMVAGDAAGDADGDGGAASAALESRLDQLEEQLAGIRTQGSAEQPAELDQRLRAAEETAGQIEALAQETGSLKQRLDELAQRLEEVSAAMPDVGTTLSAAIDELSEQTTSQGERIADISNDIEALRSDVEDLRNRMTSAGGRTEEIAGRLDSLTGRLERTEQRLDAAEQTQEKAAALAVLTSQLAGALDQGEPFQDLLEPLEALAEGDEAIGEAVARLEPIADQGAPTLATLRNRFDAIANEIVHRARAPQGEGLLDQAAGNLMRLVTVRPVGGDVEGEGASARVARAEARLAEGDLEGAVNELEQLDGSAAEVAEPWLERARTRLAAETALASLQRQAAELLGSTP